MCLPAAGWFTTPGRGMATNSVFKYYNDDDSRYEWFDAAAQKDGDPTKADEKGRQSPAPEQFRSPRR